VRDVSDRCGDAVIAGFAGHHILTVAARDLDGGCQPTTPDLTTTRAQCKPTGRSGLFAA
jgi:hypothetical protein